MRPAPRMIKKLSPWPCVATSATSAPLRSTTRLVPIVAPWLKRSVLASSAPSVRPFWAASSSRPLITPSAGVVAWVDSTLDVVMWPSSRTATQSVNVPPMSTPMKYEVTDSLSRST